MIGTIHGNIALEIIHAIIILWIKFLVTRAPCRLGLLYGIVYFTPRVFTALVKYKRVYRCQ